MKKIVLSMLVFSAATISASDRINSYSLESRVKVTMTTLTASIVSGTLACFLFDTLDDISSKVFVSVATLAGGGAGWWWSSSRTPEERFNYAAKLLDQDSTRYAMDVLFNATTSDNVFSRADRDFSEHQYPRVKLMLTIECLLHELSNTNDALKAGIATEIDRGNPNKFLIDQGRIHVQKMEQYIPVLKQWIPELKKDSTFLLQNANYEIQLLKEEVDRAASEAAFARMDADFDRWEAERARTEARFARMSPQERFEAEKQRKESSLFYKLGLTD